MPMNGIADRVLIDGLVAFILASHAAFFFCLVPSINRLERKIDSKGDSVDTKLSTKIDSVDTKLSAKIDSLDDRLRTQIKSLDSRLSSRIDALGAKIDALTVAVARGGRSVGSLTSRADPSARLNTHLARGY
jgi:hypothetical protein